MRLCASLPLALLPLLGCAARQPLPEPPLPAMSSGLASTNVFWRGQRASDGTVYPCVRIPSIIRPAPGVLLAFAECRHSMGDGCNPIGFNSSGPRDVCTRRSTDSGGSWGQLSVLVKEAGQNTAVWDAATKTVVLQFDGEGTAGRTNQQILSTDMGLTYSKPTEVVGAAQTGASTGPGRGLQLSASHRHAPNRLLFIGHHGAYQQDFIWFSDDSGKSYALSKTPTGNSLPKMDEAQLVELKNGDVLASMRNRIGAECQPHCARPPRAYRGVALSTDGGTSFSNASFDRALPEPVCMASIISAGADHDIFFANPGDFWAMQGHGRMNGRVRRSRDCTGLPSDGLCTWDPQTVTIAEGLPFGYSCLTPLNDTHIGLLWETNATLCSSDSSACLQTFSALPLSLFGPRETGPAAGWQPRRVVKA